MCSGLDHKILDSYISLSNPLIDTPQNPQNQVLFLPILEMILRIMNVQRMISRIIHRILNIVDHFQLISNPVKNDPKDSERPANYIEDQESNYDPRYP